MGGARVIFTLEAFTHDADFSVAISNSVMPRRSKYSYSPQSMDSRELYSQYQHDWPCSRLPPQDVSLISLQPSLSKSATFVEVRRPAKVEDHLMNGWMVDK